ncbi:Na+/H+ antiporter NhaC family protein [Corticicoccus populi]|uniref:Na+/H+ antiporter NhaC family protein n=1 Tax=Corticicoccus populi TaxID=1812821 RepID=A0ABW5WXX2_9STAP
MEDWGFWSVLPAIIAIVLAFATRNVIFSLFVGAFSGILILSLGNPLDAIRTLIGDYFFVQLSDGYNAGVIVLLLFIGGFVTLMEKSGGGRAFAGSATKFLNTRVKAQMGTWFGGIIIFFSDLGTPLIVGPVFESLYDKLKISREKLAWIIDSTASPVAVMVPFIGWGVYIMGLINQEYQRLGITESDFTAFMNSLPFFIYPILAVLIVPLIVFTKLDFGPMKNAEKRTFETGERFWPNSKPMRMPEDLKAAENSRSKPILIWLPLIVLFVTLFGLLIPQGFPMTPVDGDIFRVALTTAYLFAGLTLLILMVGFKVKTIAESFEIYTSGMQKMTNVIIILILAWSLGGVLGAMGTAEYIVQLVDGNVPLVFVPLLIFIVGAVMSFASGSSWGTFAIMLPLAIPLAFHLDISIYIAIGAVISAGIFGDHCSPISDTTVLSSTGAGCDHIDHNKTQIPIAVFNSVITMAALMFASITESQWTALFAIVLMVIGTFILSRFNFKEKNA